MRFRSALSVAAVILLLAGCSTAPSTAPEGPELPANYDLPLAELDLLADPLSFEGPSTAVLAATDVNAPSSPPQQQLPVSVTSHDLDGDVKVTVSSTERILALDIAGSIAATVFGLGFGDSVVGRDTSSTFPQAADLPVVTNGGHSINSEAVLALEPTVVITDGTIGPIDVILQLRDAGIPVVFVSRTPSLDGVGELARDVASALGAPAAGESLAESLAAGLDAKVAEIAAVSPPAPLRMVFLYLRGSAGIYYLFGSESGADELITSLGGRDVAGEMGWTGMRPITDEALVSADPDLILVMTDGLSSVGGVDGLLADKPAIALTAAGQKKRIVDMADGEILSFGPRTADVLDALARAIYAPPVAD
ncbi:hemin receptor [Glaciihabitans arcticus]|uniref:Hemin receptor n=1 Tax=Glaciihabitans arcticus TaxID=2668039 RepID=A0A4Q9GZ28_9MICO|nr:ABC transporter substrate-binding protein [Glaciihabitans arcticus]TBN57600.1 hemin receptor [Glaciihabitans arcticus]